MNKLRTARVLMAVTIIVIIAFQVYWMRKLYAEEQANFKKTTDIIFRETIYRLQADRFTGDTKLLTMGKDNIFMTDVISTVQQVKISKDSSSKPRIIVRMGADSHYVFNEDAMRKSGKDTMIYVNTGVANKTPPLHIERFLSGNQTLNDTIAIERIDSMYNALLAKEGINVHYQIFKKDPPLQKDTAGKKITIRISDPGVLPTFSTRSVPVGFAQPTFYTATFDNPAIYLLKKISLPILLSVLMIALTILSFIFIYRSLVAQKKLTAIKNEFIGNITHELKTPIATVSVAIEAMKNFNALQSPERTQEYLGIAGHELNRLSLLVDKVLRLSMFETQKVELKYEWFDIKDLVKDVMASMQLQFEKTDADVTLQLQGEGFTLMADQMHITSVIYNLLDNALKYSKGKPRIDITIEAVPEAVLLKVKDCGIGIPASYKDRIFDKFFRVPNGDKHNVKGYGLGLSYVAHIIEEHLGSIEVQSEEGKGTTFIIKLPKENVGS